MDPFRNNNPHSKESSSSLELGEAEIRIMKFTISMSTPVTILPLHPTGLVTVPEGTSLRVFCQADGVPLPNLQWNRNFQPIDQEILHQQNISIKAGVKSSSSTLKFHSIKYEDSGSYSCQATNKHGQVQKSVRLKVTKTTTVSITTPSLCDQIPNYCLHGRCISGVGSRRGFICLCSENYEGARCDQLVTPKNKLKVQSPKDRIGRSNECLDNDCSWTSNYLFFYVAFGFLIFILALLLIVFLLQRKRRNQLRSLTRFRKTQDSKNQEISPLSSEDRKLTAPSDINFKSVFCKECENHTLGGVKSGGKFRELHHSSDLGYSSLLTSGGTHNTDEAVTPTLQSYCSGSGGETLIGPQRYSHDQTRQQIMSSNFQSTSSRPIFHNQQSHSAVGLHDEENSFSSNMIVHPCIYIDNPHIIPLYTLDHKSSPSIQVFRNSRRINHRSNTNPSNINSDNNNIGNSALVASLNQPVRQDQISSHSIPLSVPTPIPLRTTSFGNKGHLTTQIPDQYQENVC